MDHLIKTLHEGNHSLVLDNGTLHTFDGKGVSDLHTLINKQPGLLHGASAADKVVGKAAAALLALGGVKAVFADVISEPAWILLEAANVEVTFGKRVPHIINRSGTGWCPLETRCQHCLTAKECLAEIEKFLHEQKP